MRATARFHGGSVTLFRRQSQLDTVPAGNTTSMPPWRNHDHRIDKRFAIGKRRLYAPRKYVDRNYQLSNFRH